VAGVDDVVLAGGGVLAAEDLHHLDAAQVLLSEGVHGREPDPDLAERPPHRRSRVVHQDHQERQRGEGDQGQLPVEREHDDRDADHADRVGHQGDHARREHLVDALDVVGHPGQEAPDRHAVEEPGPPRHDVVVAGQAEVVHGALAEELDRPLLAERHQHLAEHQRQVGQGDRPQAVELVDRDVIGDRDLDQVRLGQLEGDRGQGERQPHQEQPGVGADEPAELAHQPDVVGLAQHLFPLSHGASVVSWVRYSSA
jgi:hypothetical protein